MTDEQAHLEVTSQGALEQEKANALTVSNDLLAFLRLVADKNNWGYLDESGCPKGIGKYKESWVGTGEHHPCDIADRLLMEIKS